MAAAVADLFDEFGYSVPASFYNVILKSAEGGEVPGLNFKMFQNRNNLGSDRLLDAVLHASLLVTPIGLFVQSVLSQHDLEFTHVMDCGCSINLSSHDAFVVRLDPDLKAAYLQNMLAASFEQYGVNATTSRRKRGF